MGYSGTYPSWLQPVTIILLLLNYLILFPSAIRFIKSTWRIRYETYMKSRQLNITVIFAASLLTIIIIHPILLCLHFWPLDIPNNINKTIETIIHILVIILSIIPLIGITCRLWLFYYAHKYTEALFKEKRIGLQLEKKEELRNSTTRNRQSVSPFVSTPKQSPQIQPSYDDINIKKLKSLTLPEMDRGTSHTTSTMASIASMSPTAMTSAEDIIKMESTLTNPLQFYINHRQTLGSFRFVKYICIVLYALDIGVITLFSIVHIFTSYFIQAIIFLILFLFLQFHVYKLSPFRDEFFVKKQFVIEMKIVYFNLLLWIICLIVWYFIDDSSDELRIAIRLLLDTNMTLTSFLLIVAQFAVPMFRFEEGIDTLSNRNVLMTAKDKSKRLKISLFQCIAHTEGYYLFLEYLMKEFSFENLLYFTEVAYMKQKFEKTVIVPRNKSDSNSVASSIKNAFHALSERKRSQESSTSNDNNIITANNTKIKHEPKSLRLRKLRDIPSNDAIVTTQSEVENIMNKSANDLIEENKLDSNDMNVKIESDSEQNEFDNNEKKIVEMGVINGKKLTISMNALKNNSKHSTDWSTASIINDRNLTGTIKLPNLPHTVTMAESMKQNNLFDSVDMIYDNFIDKRAQYQINISSNVRRDITKIVMKHRASVEAQREKLKSLDIDHGGVIPSGLSGIIVDVHVFDDSITEILALLRSSFYRFAQTKQYKIYCTAMGK